MVSGTWNNQDGLYLQFGTQKAVPEVGGDYVTYGENRELEFYVPFVPTTWGTGNVSVPGVQTSAFSGTSTAIAAGIQSLTTLFPLQVTAPEAAASSAQTYSKPQIFIERLELLTLQTIAPTTLTMTMGLVVNAPGTPNSTLTQVTSALGTGNAAQLIGDGTALTLNTNVGTAGIYTLFTQPTALGAAFKGGVPVTTTGNSGAWIGTNVPLITNAITPLPSTAYISTLVTGTPTAGLLKVRIKYFIYGNINY